MINITLVSTECPPLLDSPKTCIKRLCNSEDPICICKRADAGSRYNKDKSSPRLTKRWIPHEVKLCQVSGEIKFVLLVQVSVKGDERVNP